MQDLNFNDMSAEDLLAWIENANKALEQKVAAEKAEIEERQQRLARLIARRAGKDDKAKAKAKAKAKGKADAKADGKPASKPRGRPAKPQDAKASEAKATESPEAAED
jgi:hypothetical protein